MTLAGLKSETFGSVKVNDALEQRANEHFLKTGLFFAIVDGRHHLSCVRELASLGRLGTEQASRRLRLKATTAPGSKHFTHFELLRLSSFTSVLSEFVLQNLSSTEVLKSMLEYSMTFDSSCNVFLEKTLVADATRVPNSEILVEAFVKSKDRR